MLQSNQTEPKELAKTANINLDLTQKSYKRIPNEVKDKILIKGIQTITEKFKFETSNVSIGSVNQYNIYCKNSTEKALKELEMWILYNFEEVLEKETGEDRSVFFRTETLFESVLNEDNLIIYWSK